MPLHVANVGERADPFPPDPLKVRKEAKKNRGRRVCRVCRVVLQGVQGLFAGCNLIETKQRDFLTVL